MRTRLLTLSRWPLGRAARAFSFFLLGCLFAAVARADVFLVPNAAGDAVVRVNGAGAKANLLAAGLNTPEQAIVDAAGNLYVADSGLGQVLMVPAGGGAPVPVGDTVAGLCTLAFDEAGVLHAGSLTDRTIRKLNAGTFVIVATLPVGSVPRSIAFEPGGNLFVADNAGSHIYEVTAGGNATIFSNDVTNPFAVAFDAMGKLHAIDTQQGGRLVFFAGGNANNNAKEASRGLGAVRGLAFDKANIAHYLTSNGELRKVTGKTTSELVTDGLGDPRLLSAKAVATRVIAFKGQTLANPNGAILSVLNSPATGGGAVAFKGTLQAGVAGVASSNAIGVWRSDFNGALTLLARRSFPPPAMPNEAISTLADPILNNNGKVAFIGTLVPGVGDATAANSKVIFSDVGGTLEPVLRKSDPAPGTGLDPAVKFTNFTQMVLPDDAGVAVIATIAGPGVTKANNLGLWSLDPAGNPALVVRKGDTINAGGKDRKLAALSLFKPTPLSLGQGRHAASNRQFTFLAKFTDGFVAPILVQPSVAPTVLAEKAGPVGAAIAGAQFTGFGSPSVSNDAATFSFVGKLRPGLGGVTTASAVAIFTQTAGTNELIAQRTFGAPEVNGAFFSTLSDPIMNRASFSAFLGKMKPGLGGVLTTTSAGLWVDQTLGPELAVRQGEVAAGIDGAVKFTAFKQFVLPDSGSVVFTATVAGQGITTANNLGLWASDGVGSNELLLRKGDKLKINNQTRTVTSFIIFKTIAGLTGQSRHFDAAGNVTCLIACSDGTRAIVLLQRP